ncbi:hypothetical protein ELG72_27995 (plasmid) [Rhizobium leguminosarum]|uniref:hypothetical protein n=1 Tax=Rhizobium leguminosarum TaxID=384 RepID=UPI00102F532A|nr:hypothetical protein [Rhizobium leguminosarum]MBY5374609.1 hypothetical protein [Rhizobium leguminosarum]TBF25671.1 hypothetical protein ELG92_33085 [Rhizobium leguminosarum]TBF44624.1 hypothetical protein ELG91_32300 [Rhizobium leguminosarum]TBF45493.1 hypothetical protein ELG90_33345 [Rhizobium leguminosarum]TBF47854.1 hypothetical protein ELG87_29270 [Rhizobium leguminosarum]
MNRLDPPDFFDDDAALDALSLNVLLKSYPHLQQHVPSIKAGYAQYIAANGNVSAINKVPLPKPIEDYLKNLYGSQPGDIAYIGEIREESDPDCCPMCGSFHSGTLDHLMPKAQYASFAIFSRNLVPACKCNTKRASIITGPNAGERVLHPYFDDILGERLIATRFEDLGLIPRVTLRILIDQNNPHYAAVTFHIDNIVRRTSILRYMSKSWNRMLRHPSVAAAELRHDPPSLAALQAILESELERQDITHGSKNNWQSVFISGLLENHVLDWLLAAFQRPGRSHNGSLLPSLI